MLDLITPLADYGFMRRALIAGLALSLAAPPLGVFLMLRGMSLIGDAMAHAILPGVALGFLMAGFSLPAMSLGGILSGLVVAGLAGGVSQMTGHREDSAMASFYLISLAGGVMLVSLGGSSVDLTHVLFGSILAVDTTALLLIAAVSTVTVLLLAGGHGQWTTPHQLLERHGVAGLTTSAPFAPLNLSDSSSCST